MKKISPIDDEVPYEVDDFFFSITDKKGIITSYNQVFPRVSGYSDEELLGHPHNLVRHPDMPKSVFKYFWDCLKRNENVIAYVKNMAKDGRYYWVLAYVFQTKNSYISIRMKPTSDFLTNIILPIYKKMKEIEEAESVDHALSYMVDELTKVGYINYTDFSSKSLVKEITSKNKILYDRNQSLLDQGALKPKFLSIGSELFNLSLTYVSIMNLLDSVDSDSVVFKDNSLKILKTCNQLRYLVINMSLAAKKMGADGLIFSEISQWFERFSESIYLNVKDFETSMNDVIQKIVNSRLTIAGSSLKIDMAMKYVSELSENANKNGLLTSEAFGHLSFLVSETGNNSSVPDITLANRDIKKYGREVKNLDANIIGLEVIRITGKIESAASSVANNIFNHHLRMINEYIKNVRGAIAQITNTIESLDDDTRSIELANKVIGYNIEKVGHLLRDIKSELKI